MTAPIRHRTARELAAAANAQAAVERAQAHTEPSPETESGGKVGGYVTPAVARHIRELIEGRAA